MTTDDYQQFTQDMRVRALASLNTMSDGLVASGVAANRITVIEEDSNNLRFRITALRGARTLVAYFELTPVGADANGNMTVVITLYVEGNGSEITHSYTTGVPITFTDIAPLLAKLTAAELTMGEVLVKARAFLQV